MTESFIGFGYDTAVLVHNFGEVIEAGNAPF